MNKLLKGTALALVAVPVLAGRAMAAPVDYTTLTTSVDFASAITAILVVFAAIAGVGVAFKGGRLVLKALGIS